MESKKAGRPEKDYNVRKAIHKSIRFDYDTNSKLDYIRRMTGMSYSKIIRDAINMMFMDKIHK